MDVRIDLASEGDAGVVRIGGELDVEGVPELENAFSELRGSDSERLVIDLGDCDFIDSAGLAAILHGALQLRDAASDVRIACPEGNLRQLLRITAIDQSIPVVATRAEALAALGLGD